MRYDPESGNVIVRAEAELGPATIKLLDHHRVPLVTRRETVKPGETVFAFHSKAKVGAIYLQLGAFRDWVVGDSYGQIADEWAKPPASDE